MQIKKLLALAFILLASCDTNKSLVVGGPAENESSSSVAMSSSVGVGISSSEVAEACPWEWRQLDSVKASDGEDAVWGCGFVAVRAVAALKDSLSHAGNIPCDTVLDCRMVVEARQQYFFYSRNEFQRQDVERLADSIMDWRLQYVPVYDALMHTDPWPQACVEHRCVYEWDRYAEPKWYEQNGILSWDPEPESIEQNVTCSSLDDCHAVKGSCTWLGYSSKTSDSTRMQFMVDSLDVLNEMFTSKGSCAADNADYVPSACEEGLCKFKWVERP